MKKEKRGLLERIFAKKTTLPRNATTYQFFDGYNAIYTTLDKDTYNSKVARQCIDRIATNVAKLEPKHIKTNLSAVQESQIGYLLANRPNPINNTFDFLYRITSLLYTDCNAFIYIERDGKNMITGLYPVYSQSFVLYQNADTGEIYLQVTSMQGVQYYLPYLELIHLRLFYNRNDIFGTLDNVLRTDLQTALTSSEGIGNAIKTSTSLKGILRFTNAMIKEADLKKSKELFVQDYLNLENSGGIAALDGKAEFQEINLKPILLDADQLKMVNYNIYDYFGISEDIVKNDFTTDQWNAFYEGIVEPRAMQMGYEFTNKIFNKKGIKEGHRIIFSTNRLMYATLADKINLLKNCAAYGMIKTDEAREILGLAPIRRKRRRKNFTVFKLNRYNYCKSIPSW